MARTRFVAAILLWIVSNEFREVCAQLSAEPLKRESDLLQPQEYKLKKDKSSQNQETKTIKKTGKGEKKYKSAIEKESERGDSQKRTCNWRAEGTLRCDAKEETDQLNLVV